jgi:hypothetical protein
MSALSSRPYEPKRIAVSGSPICSVATRWFSLYRRTSPLSIATSSALRLRVFLSSSVSIDVIGWSRYTEYVCARRRREGAYGRCLRLGMRGCKKGSAGGRAGGRVGGGAGAAPEARVGGRAPSCP